MKRFDNSSGNKGQAIVVVITLIAMLSIIGVAFFSLGQMERNSGTRNLDALRARYLAEAGVTYAHTILTLDAKNNTIDSLADISFQQFAGNETDLDSDSTADARWVNVTDAEGLNAGRFAVKVSDESGKININTCSRELLEGILSQSGADAGSAASIIDSRPLNAVEQAGSLIGKGNFAKVKNYITIYSKDLETDLSKKRRIYINSPSAHALLEAFISAGISFPHQKAANLKDAADKDLAQTVLNKFSLSRQYPSQLTESGSWVRSGSSYEAPSGTETGKFSWSNLQVADGEYYCFLYAIKDTDTIGEVSSDDNLQDGELLHYGEGLSRKVKVSGKSLTLNIKPVSPGPCSFSYIELAALEPQEGLQIKEIFGCEALVINELMVNLTQEVALPDSVQIPPGQVYKYTANGMRPGYCYLSLKSGSAGGKIGDVTANSSYGGTLSDGDYFPKPIKIDASGLIVIEIKNNTLANTTFKGFKISQGPDAEYAEIVNLSPTAIDLSGFSLEVLNSSEMMVAGWPARIPPGTAIQPYQHLVLAVDANNSEPAPIKLRSNDLYFGSNFNGSAVGLDFEEYTDSIDKTFDLFPDKGGYVVLKDAAGRQVDKVQYKLADIKAFSALERGDPAYQQGGVFYQWNSPDSSEKASPALNNDNSGMYTFDADNKPLKHSPSEKIVYNRPLNDFYEVLKISSGENWKTFSLSDLSRLGDHVSFQKIILPLAGHYKSGTFKEGGAIFESSKEGDAGTWEFNDVACGDYLLSIFSGDLNIESLKLKVAYKTKEESLFESYSELMFAQGTAFFGRVELPGEGKSFFSLQMVNDSDNKKITLKEIQLEPVFSSYGRVNVNTASPAVLQAVFASASLAEKVLSNRPIGLKGGVKLGIGELFFLDAGFIPFADSLTVRSDVYEIKSQGEYMINNKTAAFQTIRTVIERIE